MLTGIIRFRKVEEVTAGKDEATPVYLLDELVKATQGSPEDAQHIVEHLVKKLDSKNPVVKAKSLRACKYLVQKGAKDAHRILQRNAGPIRQLQNYRGVPDPLKGEALNDRVRTSAKEAVAVIFSADAASTSISTSAQSRIQGFGSDSVLPSVGGSVDSSNRMTGFGSDRFSGHQVERVTTVPVRSVQTTSTTFTTNRRTTSFLSEDSKVEMMNGQRHVQNGHGHGSVIGDEEQLVNSICQPIGVRSAPAPEDLRRFIDTAGSLNGPQIATKLQQKLESNNWQECYRALCAIEMVILKGSSVSCGEIGVHFQSDLDIIRRCTKSMQRTVRDRAQKILDIFVEADDGVAKDPEPVLPEAPLLIEAMVADPQTNPPSSSMIDLLDDDIVEASPEPPNSSEMFGGLEIAPMEPVAMPPTGFSQTATGDGSQISSSMFVGLAVSNSSAPANEGNAHLAALLAPSPASDPFPEAGTPLKAESGLLQQPPQLPLGNPSQFPVPIQNSMPPYAMPQAATMGTPYTMRTPVMPQQHPGGMPYMNGVMQPGLVPAGHGAPVMQPYPNHVQPTQSQAFHSQGNRGEVPLAAFMGPVHTERRNPSGKGSAFGFVVDHISEMRERK